MTSQTTLGLVLVALCTSLAPPGLIAPAPLSEQETEEIRLSRVIDVLDGGDAALGILSGDWSIQTVLAAYLRHDVPCAIATGAGSVEERLSQGFRMVTVGGDGGIRAGTARALGLGRSAAGR